MVKTLGHVLIAIGVVVIVGWVVEVSFLKSIFPGLATMKFNTALCFSLAGVGIASYNKNYEKKYISLTTTVGVLIFLISAISLSEYIFKMNVGIDELIVKDDIIKLDLAPPGRMSPATAFCFILTGLSFLFIFFRKNSPFLISASFILVLSLFDIVGYLYNYDQLYDIFAFSSMAIHTSIAFSIFSIGIIAAKPPQEIIEILKSNYPGVVMTRRLLIPVIGSTILMGGIVIAIVENNFVGYDIGITILVAFILILSILACWHSAHLLNNTYATLQTLNRSLDKRVIERTKELESFTYSVSHDLRAPLRAISGYAKMLEQDYNKIMDKEGNRLLSIIQDGAKTMGLLIEDLLALSKLGRQVLRKSNVDMTQLVNSALQEINNTVSHKAEVRINNLQSVIADYSLLTRVVTNLLSNAIKYSSKVENPVIEVRSKIEDEEVIYSVKDNGAGFDMKYADKLFGVFQRLHSENEFEGIGVGLAIVSLIIKKHDGKVWADGKVNEGATFYFSLPSQIVN